MREIIIDEEFKSLLPALDNDTYVWLEENIIEYGCRDPLVLWEGILIDGHNRYEICMEHGIPFNTISMEFDSRDKVLIWIITTQISRRNLTPFQLSFYRGLHYNADKRTYGNIDRLTQPLQSDKSASNGQSFPSGQNDHFHESTANRLADLYNISNRTVRRDAQLAEAVEAIGNTSPAAKRDILAGKARISKKKLYELSAGPEEYIIDVAERIENGTYEKNMPVLVEPQPLVKDLKKITSNFYRELRELSERGNTNAFKSTFKLYIETLEEMYSYL